jgi:MoxR-like ATPase
MPAKTFVARLQRQQSKKPADAVLQKTVDYFVERALDDTGMAAEGWVLQEWRPKEPYENDVYLVLTLDLFFSRSGKKGATGSLTKQFEKIANALERAGHNTAKFGDHDWTWSDPEQALPSEQVSPDPEPEEDDPETLAHSMTEGGLPKVVLTVDEIVFPESLIDASESEIEFHPIFKGIYERGPHIRLVLGAMNDARLTNFEAANHLLLFGPTGVAKTILLRRLRLLFGEGAFLWINCPSASKAGIEHLFLKKYRNACPLWVVLEEIDKTPTEVLNVLLPALDEERRITKHQHNNDDSVEFRSQVIASCNNKRRLDSIQGGALVNRFGLQLYCPRPNQATMKRILLDKIARRGGDPAWADSCVDMMDLFHTNDPRRVQAWLTGRERLDGRFQDDLVSIHKDYVRDLKVITQLAIDEMNPLSDQEIAMREAERMGLNGKASVRKKNR